MRSIRPDRLREVIEKPAALAGARLEPGLAEAMLHDAGDESGNLALLEHALTELWERRAGGLLSHASYESIGRLEGALEHRAEEVYGSLDREEQRLARRIFLRLTEPGEGTGATRRRVRRQPAADPEGPEAAVERVLDRLVRQRLVTVGQEPGEESETVELAHEALIRGWRRLQRWLEADRESLPWRRRLQVSLDSWQEAGQEEGALLRGGLLAEAERWLGERRDDLEAGQLGFIEASIARRRRGRRLKAAVVAVLALLALAATAGGAGGAAPEPVGGRRGGDLARHRRLPDRPLRGLRPQERRGPHGHRPRPPRPGRREDSAGALRAAGSERHLLRSLELLESDGSLAESVLAGMVLHNLAEMHRAQGRVERAEAGYRRSDAIFRGALDPGHPNIAENERGLANLYRDSGRMSEAEPLYRRALASLQEALGSDHPRTAETRQDFAAYLRAAGRAQEAAALEVGGSADAP